MRPDLAFAAATLTRITSGIFHLFNGQLIQIKRIQMLNSLGTLTPEVVGTARKALITGH